MRIMKKPADPERLIRELDWNLLRTFMYVVQEGRRCEVVEQSWLLS